MELLILDTSHRWNPTICDLLRPASFTYHHAFYGLCCSLHQYLIPFYCQIIFTFMDIPCFACPVIHWLGFHLLAIIIMLQWTFMEVFCVWKHVSLPSSGYISRNGICFLCFSFSGIAKLFSKGLHHSTILTARCEGLSFSPFLPILVLVCPFNYILVGVNWSLTVVLICIFLKTNNIRASFHILIGSLYIFFKKILFQSFAKLTSWRQMVGDN